jgi:hypothetical protein
MNNMIIVNFANDIWFLVLIFIITNLFSKWHNLIENIIEKIYTLHFYTHINLFFYWRLICLTIKIANQCYNIYFNMIFNMQNQYCKNVKSL